MQNSVPSTTDAKQHWEVKASAWTNWADPMEKMAARFNEPLLETANLTNGQTVLDLASGVGEPAISAARMIAPDGLCYATDFVPEMLSGIQQRNTQNNLFLAAADMQQLPFSDALFDRIICRFGIMFAPDTKKSVAELCRTLKPGGKLALMVWGKRQDQTIFNCLSNAIEEVYKIKPDDHHFSIFRFGAENSLSQFFKTDNFSSINEETHSFTAYVSQDKPFWRPQLDMSFGHLISSLDNNLRPELDKEIRKQLSQYISRDKFVLESKIKIISATRI